jgi:hypothetical protein
MPKPTIKLGRLESGDHRELKFQLILDPLIGQDFQLYIAAYKETYPDAPDPELAKVAAALIRDFLASDKGFTAYKRERLNPSAAKAASE